MPIRVDQEKQDHTDRHQIHVNAEDDPGVIVPPSQSHATDRLTCSKDREQGRQDEQKGRPIMRKVRHEDGEEKATDYQYVPPRERVVAQVQELDAVAWDVGDLNLHVSSE